jgi:hypothetical protein
MDVNSSTGMVFCMRSERWPCDATIETLLKVVFSMRYVPGLYNEDQLRRRQPIQVLDFLALSNGPKRVGVSHLLTRGRKQIQFPNLLCSFVVFRIPDVGHSPQTQQSQVLCTIVSALQKANIISTPDTREFHFWPKRRVFYL